jgi:hypothetical protein
MEPGLDKNKKISQRIEKKNKHKCSKQQREALRLARRKTNNGLFALFCVHRVWV